VADNIGFELVLGMKTKALICTFPALVLNVIERVVSPFVQMGGDQVADTVPFGPPPPPQLDLHGVAVAGSGGVAVGVGDAAGVCELGMGLLPGVPPPVQFGTVGV
jgi:hypothetical protein